MKILQKGTKEIDNWIGKCNSCDSIISADIDEIKYFTIGDYRSDYEDYAWENCPFCYKSQGICFHRQHTKSGQELFDKCKEK